MVAATERGVPGVALTKVNAQAFGVDPGSVTYASVMEFMDGEGENSVRLYATDKLGPTFAFPVLGIGKLEPAYKNVYALKVLLTDSIGYWPAPGDGETPVRLLRRAPVSQSLGIRSDRLTFGPFTASWRMDDGRWATVEPPRDFLSPWQKRILLALALSALILAPLVWWMARRLTRPIRVFAEAAKRLGAYPDAEPLTPSGTAEVLTAIHLP